ncbi:hypothetical protein DOY81_002448, partial [Sarcophaga bullata]
KLYKKIYVCREIVNAFQSKSTMNSYCEVYQLRQPTTMANRAIRIYMPYSA